MARGLVWIGAIAGAVLALLAGAAWYSLWLPGSGRGTGAGAAGDPGLAQRLRRHVEAVASVPHNTQHPAGLEQAARYIEGALGGLGVAIERQDYRAGGVAVRNVWTDLKAAAPGDSRGLLVIGAHYDAFGVAPGANDNGSGTAALLELARLLKDDPPGKLRLRLAFLVNEEMPYFGTELMGSRKLVRLMLERAERIDGMISLETLGSFYDRPGTQRYPAPYNLVFPTTGDFVAFVGMPGSRDLLHRAVGAFRASAPPVPSIGGIAPAAIPGIAWSDHKSFADAGVPAIMITDTAPFRYQHYHRPSDTPDKLDYTTLARLTEALARMVRVLAR